MDLLRDIANPSHADPYYPIVRHKDWYLGHSWAQGVDPTYGILFIYFCNIVLIVLDGKNQESTSEAVNAYYGVYLYGLVTKNDRVRDFGRLLLATEIRRYCESLSCSQKK